MIYSVVCHSSNSECWSNGILKYSYGGIYGEIQNDFCVSYGDYDFDLYKDVTAILICYICFCLGDSA